MLILSAVPLVSTGEIYWMSVCISEPMLCWSQHAVTRLGCNLIRYPASGLVVNVTLTAGMSEKEQD